MRGWKRPFAKTEDIKTAFLDIPLDGYAYVQAISAWSLIGCARLAIFLASDLARCVACETLYADCGFHIMGVETGRPRDVLRPGALRALRYSRSGPASTS